MTRLAELEVAGTSARLTLRGEIDLLAVPELREVLERVRARHVTTMDVDLALVDFIDSSGLGVLAQAASELDRLQVVAAPITVVRILEMTGLGGLVALRQDPSP